MYPVILSGGSGTRLWPLSRATLPKQFLPLASHQSLFQDCCDRLQEIGGGAPLIITGHEHRFLVLHQLQHIGLEPRGIILEPEGRNTGPAVAIAALHAIAEDPDAVLLILPADHVIQDVKALAKALIEGQTKAEAGKIVTFGVKPTSAHTGYGYIRAGADGSIQAFKEKPDAETARAYLASGDYFWNSGMFLVRARVILKALKAADPDLAANCRKAYGDLRPDLEFLRLDETSFGACASRSIDHAVMENTQNGHMIALDAGWSDLGEWPAVWDIQEKDKAGNAIKGDVLAKGCQNSYFYSDHKLVAALGLDNIILVNTPDALLIAPRDDSRKIRELITRLEAQGRSELTSPRLVHRPWGTMEVVSGGARDQVKRITVLPGQKLSLQKHRHRAEHWVVVKGTAKVTRGDEVFLLKENQSTYISAGTVHALENPTNEPLEIIEIQSGDYLGEDDIERLEDRYGRKGSAK